ncbi:MAG TPA: acyl-CoA dehydrogenase family protein [Microthrixaceae bacterium]|nr:acyl-CoA dehydrogenase family protein [Microthrixaceae bacterium]HMT23192.1 acyl-CoA dehydrogenase family protein [Microthrixaceae bacterium]
MLTEEHEMFRSTVRGFVESEITPHADEWEAEGMFPAAELFAKMGDLGLLGLTYEPRFGGGGAEPIFTAILHEELGRMPCLGVAMAIGVQTDMATPSLHRFGTDELRERYLRPAIEGRHVAAVGITEPDAGSDVAAIRTRAVRDGDEWVISGQKLYITNGLQADWVCVLARTSDEPGARGMSQIIVPTDAPGFSVSRKLDKLGMRSSDTAELAFDEVRVPADHLIGDEGRGFHQQMQQFQDERMVAAYQMVGAMDTALVRTGEYLRERLAFGRPLIANQSLAYDLAELASEVELLRVFCRHVAEEQGRGSDITRLATIAKLRSGRLARRVADTCLQFHGGVGYMEETWTARFFRDTRLWSIGGGADEVMLRTLARLDGFWPE